MTLLSCAYAGTGNVLKVCSVVYQCINIMHQLSCLSLPHLGSKPSWSLFSTSWEGWNSPRSCCSWNCNGGNGWRTGFGDGNSFIRASFAVWGAKYSSCCSLGSWSPLHFKPQGQYDVFFDEDLLCSDLFYNFRTIKFSSQISRGEKDSNCKGQELYHFMKQFTVR